MKVLVCGGKRFNDAAFLYATLDKVHNDGLYVDDKGVELIIISSDRNGAPRLAGLWAQCHNIPQTIYTTMPGLYNLQQIGNLNQSMLDDGQPDLVVAFEGGAETRDMIRRASLAGVQVIEPKLPDLDWLIKELEEDPDL